jgi:hypothetical protein
MRWMAWCAVASAVAWGFGCGGSTTRDPAGTGAKGTGKGGSAVGGASGGVTTGGTGGITAGGAGGNFGGFGGGVAGFGGGVAGFGGACNPDACGPSGAPCCFAYTGCGSGGPGGSISCECLPAPDGTLAFVCNDGTGGMPGTGGTGGCVSFGCGPQGAPCCQPGEGCASAAGGSPGVSCYCSSSLTWECKGGFGGTGGTGGTGTCNGVACPLGTTCCSGHCVNLFNDPFNCGSCGYTCPTYPPYCSGFCTKPPCMTPIPPPPNGFCCGQSYCTGGQLCCEVQGGGPTLGPICVTPSPAQPTCPVGCPTCQ